VLHDEFATLADDVTLDMIMRAGSVIRRRASSLVTIGQRSLAPSFAF
jgi:hypothetical protein